MHSLTITLLCYPALSHCQTSKLAHCHIVKLSNCLTVTLSHCPNPIHAGATCVIVGWTVRPSWQTVTRSCYTCVHYMTVRQSDSLTVTRSCYTCVHCMTVRDSESRTVRQSDSRKVGQSDIKTVRHSDIDKVLVAKCIYLFKILIAAILFLRKGPAWYKNRWQFFQPKLSSEDVILEFLITRNMLCSGWQIWNHHF